MSKRPTLLMRNAAALILAIPFAGVAADESAQLRGIVDHAIRPVMTEFDVPGMAVAITVDGKASFFSYGVASRESKVPVSEMTLFELGSISKNFTGTLALYAQELGKLSLDEHPGKYMPQLKGRAIDKASLLHLGTYTAGGLPQQFPDEVNQERMIAYFRDWKPEQRRYSNPSIGLLGNYAWGYNKANKAVRVKPDVFSDEAYGVKSTAADMIRYVQLNIEPSLLAGPMRRAVSGTHAGHFQVRHMAQGLGWEQYAYPVALDRLLAGNSSEMAFDPHAAKRIAPPRAPSGATLYNKTGSTSGFSNYVAFVPEKKIGIVMLANRSFPSAARIKAAHAILEQVAATAR